MWQVCFQLTLFGDLAVFVLRCFISFRKLTLSSPTSKATHSVYVQYVYMCVVQVAVLTCSANPIKLGFQLYNVLRL